jgi:predicted metal-dependent peptidase
MNKEVAQQLTRARTGLILDAPFFGMLALRLQLVEDMATKTLSVDGKVIRYNPDFVATMSHELTKSALGHEVMHCVFEHIGRRGDREPRKWNQAGDYVINAALKDANFEISPNWLFSPAFAGMTTDEIYTQLPDNDDDGNGGGAGDPLDDCQDGDANSNMADAVEWKIATIQAAQAAQSMGKLPGSLKRFIDELTNPKVDWRAILQRFVSETSKNDYSWARPNKRFMAQGFMLPTLHSENMGEIVVAIDTSGSIGQAMLNAFGSEIKAIVQTMRPSLTTVIYCDSAVNHVDSFGPNDDLHFDMHGGGGTAFAPPFEHVAENDIKPVCFVYLTDGYGSFPAAPDYPTLWCMTTNVVAPFGETLPIEV